MTHTRPPTPNHDWRLRQSHNWLNSWKRDSWSLAAIVLGSKITRCSSANTTVAGLFTTLCNTTRCCCTNRATHWIVFFLSQQAHFYPMASTELALPICLRVRPASPLLRGQSHGMKKHFDLITIGGFEKTTPGPRRSEWMRNSSDGLKSSGEIDKHQPDLPEVCALNHHLRYWLSFH